MTEIVMLGGREYSLAKKKLRQASAMRKRLNERVEPLMQLAQKAPTIEIKNIEQVGGILDGLRDMMVNSIDILFDLLCEYDQKIEEDREWLLDNAIDEEVIEAALVMIKQLFPFGGILKTLNGLVENSTLTSSKNTTGSESMKRMM